ncbi:c-type cytochrome biogenesis protein CcmI [Rhodoblastus sp.]|uniref:c-type cytochrome biogenesis protein CcmI n=1 Tax=Rhodoblastus sp. TaxID=1962975 RepID=UPI003F965453
MIWFVFALLTGAAVAVLLWPLTGPPPETSEDAAQDTADIAFYRAQIAEIDAESSRGGVVSDEAEAAKAQAGRRLLAAAQEETALGDAPRARKFAILLIAFGAPSIALGLYAKVGRPNLPDMPLASRPAPQPAPETAKSLAELEADLAVHPKDGAALERITPLYLAAWRYDDAVRTSKAAIDILGESPERLVKYAEALSYANDGEVSPQAAIQLQRALQLAPGYLLARYYLGLAAAQQGEVDKARKIWTAMLPELKQGSKAKKDVLDKLALLDAPVDGAASSSDRQQESIQAMVETAAQRLAAKGGNAEEWMRLIRSYMVLKQPDKARDAYDRARKSLAGDATAQQKLDALAKELGLKGM